MSDESDRRVFMVARAHSPRRIAGEGNPGGNRNNGDAENNRNDGGPGLINVNNMGAMEADWRQQQFQRQRMQLLSMAIFLCFMVLFFDNRAGEARHRAAERSGRNRYSIPDSQGLNVSERKKQADELEKVLHDQPDYMPNIPPMNVSGIYSGTWKSLSAEEYDTEKPVYSDVIPYLKVDRDIHDQDYEQPEELGSSWLFLKMKTPPIKELEDDVSYVTGQLVIYEEQASLAATILPVQGVFLRRMAKLTLFGNSPDSTVQLLYRKPNATSNSTTSVTVKKPPVDTADAEWSEVEEGKPLTTNLRWRQTIDLRSGRARVEGVPNVVDKQDFASVDVSPPRYAYVSRFRSSDSFSDQCLSIVEMTLRNSTKGGQEDGELSNQKGSTLDGTLASVNCGLYLQLSTDFQEENLDVFFSKASHYAVLMTLIAMVEIYVLLRQLQFSNTQAAAARVSLVTVGQQAILDSYLCLGHLTIGIVAQNVFTAFASVAFVKLIIFSVFEMRYLLIIWKARRPQGFAEGWLTLRRELTTLYSRFYISLLAGLVILYNFSNYASVLVFLCYSFWVPQIVHNVHREVRNAFDPGYLYGMSGLRMFLPLYFFGCPSNFLSAFPMYENSVDYQLCYSLMAWMGLQLCTIFLQQRLGPRFFVPAMFLPVKYNYERKVTMQDLALLRNNPGDGDSAIDCVICMVELDVDTEDYMIAPCDHIFHRDCLQGWMQVKMECPTCRCALPEP